MYGLVTVAVLGLGMPAAHAADSYTGQCELRSLNSGLMQPDERWGLISGSFRAVDTITFALLPIDVHCWVEVNGVPDPDATAHFSGTGGAAGAQDVYFVAGDEDVIELCWTVHYGSSRAAGCAPPPVSPNASVNGHIIIDRVGTSQPTYQTTGVLADPLSWSCTDNGSATPYQVSCVPRTDGAVFIWSCDLVHTQIMTLASGAVGRTTLDCDNGGPPEGATTVASGVGGFDFDLSAGGVLAKTFTCTIDDGSGGEAIGTLQAMCGDPGVPTTG